MIFELRQTYKELFSAGFVIVRKNNEIMGDAKLVGNIFTPEGDFFINYGHDSVFLSRSKRNVDKRIIEKDCTNPFKPYDIFINNQYTGIVYHADVKIPGRFLSSRPRVVKLHLYGNIYTFYSICFGEDGGKSPIYFNNKQICESHKPCIVYDDLNIYTIYTTNYSDALIGLLFDSYLYTVGAYKAGVKRSSSVTKKIYTNNDPYLLSKYNPDFIQNVEP